MYKTCQIANRDVANNQAMYTLNRVHSHWHSKPLTNPVNWENFHVSLNSVLKERELPTGIVQQAHQETSLSFLPSPSFWKMKASFRRVYSTRCEASFRSGHNSQCVIGRLHSGSICLWEAIRNGSRTTIPLLITLVSSKNRYSNRHLLLPHSRFSG